MKLVRNESEFLKTYPYSTSTYKSKLPKEYPCFVKWEKLEGGLIGPYYVCDVVYVPKDCDLYSFEKGLNSDPALLYNEASEYISRLR